MSKNLNLAVKYFINNLNPCPLKLQKLLYFAQGMSFCANDKELFSEDMEAWVHGPVVPDVYRSYMSYGREPITTYYEEEPIPEDVLSVLDSVAKTYGKYDAKYLEKLTHDQAPWLYARSGLDPDERSDKTIPKDLISDYFISMMFQPTAKDWE